ncbi:arginine deiminase family protein [Picrophilus oshimae]|uniref:Arginine deiminase n=1 Tax=Picrophilus torridus (strain ATCC 700027 / DSM 9790 / JCM 10055 / NBRC 100828 / KAW 2/3) TaxID=1122961 RepID=A0A8G2FWV6_PICTO|nr:arginine deiminase family protein [Picrophilus oshimae]SMD30979.1 arginine deiminase [Picrophilus oshimae DSM 9789]
MIRAEWNSLKKVMLHRPGMEINYAMFAPKAFLFERPFNYMRAIEEHKMLEEKLKENNINVIILKDEIIKKALESDAFMDKLREKVISIVKYYGTKELIENARNDLEKNIKYIDPETLFNAFITELSIDLKSYLNGIEYPTVYSNLPLANLYFMRDQQAISSGIIIGNMRMNQRRKETDITEFFFREVLNENRITRVKNGYFEGGDFMPAGSFAIIGTGSRTDINGAIDAMNSGLMDFDEILIVNNPNYDFMSYNPQFNMHLDTYFNIAGDGIVVTSENLIKNAAATLYQKNGDKYERAFETTLFDYIKKRDFNIIDMNLAEQLSYSSNFLTLSDKKIIAVDSKRIIEKLIKEKVFPGNIENMIKKQISNEFMPDKRAMIDHGIDVIKIDLSEITGGYGGAHCMSSAIIRN